MKAETQSALELIRDVAAALVDEPGELNLGHQTALDGATYFALKCAKRDEPRLIGVSGAHVKSLEYVVHLMGAHAGAPYTFRLVTTGGPRVRAWEPRAAVEFDPEPTFALLDRVLDAIGITTAQIEAGPGVGPRETLTFEVKIGVISIDANFLRRADDEDRFDGFVPISALETIFGAIGKRQGVTIVLALEVVA